MNLVNRIIILHIFNTFYFSNNYLFTKHLKVRVMIYLSLLKGSKKCMINPVITYYTSFRTFKTKLIYEYQHNIIYKNLSIVITFSHTYLLRYCNIYLYTHLCTWIGRNFPLSIVHRNIKIG